MIHETVLATVQRQMELQDATLGAEKYIKNQEAKAQFEGFERRDDVAKLIRGAIPIVSTALKDWVATAEARKGRPHAALAPLREVDPDVIALAALSKTFHTVAKNLALSATAKAIGHAVQVEVEARMIGNKDAKAAKRFLAMASGESSERTTLKRHAKLAGQLGVSLEWDQRTQVLVGSVVLNAILIAIPEVFRRGMVKDHRGTTPVIRIAPEAWEHLQEMAQHTAWLQPLLKPMIAPPRKWTQYDSGAYLEYSLSRTVPMVRTFSREHQGLIRAAIKDGSMAEAMEGLNAIQSTRFAIDRRVLDVVTWVKGEGHQPKKSFPLSDVPAKPLKTPAEEWEAMSPEARTAQSRKRKSMRDLIEAAQVNKSVFETDVGEALRLADVDAFYLPHSFDFRGRVYAVPHFNPQRSDHVKALFRFADRFPMGPEGGKWLAIHLANCGDYGKVSKQDFAARVAWVVDNEEAILEVAQDPAGTYSWWKDADSPFCFLQACFEWAEFQATGYSEAFEGCIGVALDGSCSGLQHYSAMTRAEEEGYHVNLLPRPTPGDIYQVVGDRALPVLQLCSDRGDVSASLILANGFGRGNVKTNVMTYFYGSERFGMRDQHMNDTMRPAADLVALGEIKAHPYAMMTVRKNKDTGEETEQLDGGFTCAQTLANVIYDAVISVAPMAQAASEWFQQVAAVLAHESLPVIWRSPTGLPVVQRYSEYVSKRVNLWLYDRKVLVATGDAKVDGEGKVMSRVECLIREAPTKRIDKKKARSAISPNLVHSLDAAHLVRSVVMAHRQGISSFQLIHDSFATHAGKTERFAEVIREAMVDMYETYDPFVEIDTYARSVLSEEGQEKLPPIPARGSLDLKQLLLSAYAFA